MRRFLSTLGRSGKNKPEVRRKRRQARTRVGYPFHEWLTKNQDFLVQPTGASDIIGGQRALPRRAARQSPWQVPHPPCQWGQGGRERRYAGNA